MSLGPSTRAKEERPFHKPPFITVVAEVINCPAFPGLTPMVTLKLELGGCGHQTLPRVRVLNCCFPLCVCVFRKNI